MAEQPQILHRQAELTHYVTTSMDKMVTWMKYTKSDDWMLWKPTFEINLSNTPDRIPSTTPGAEPPRDAKDSGSARSHSTHLETSSSDRP